MYCFNNIMTMSRDKIINKFLLAVDKFMLEMDLRQPGFIYSACAPFTKTSERINNFMKIGNTKHINRNELDKACFQHDMAYGASKKLVKRTYSDKVLMDKAFKIASNPKYDGYQRGLASMVYKFFNKKTRVGRGVTRQGNISSKNNPKYQLVSKLHAPIIKKFTKRKVYAPYIDHICVVDLVDLQKLSNKNKGIKYLLCVIDIYSKYAWVKGLKDKKGISVRNGFKEMMDESKQKPDKIWVDNGREYYNIFFQKFLRDNNIEMYSIYNEGKSLVAERFIRALKTIYDCY